MWDPLIVVMTVLSAGLVGLVFLLLPFALRERRRSDHQRIEQEAAQRNCSVRSVRSDWLNPFPRCRCYRVICHEEVGGRRVARVIIGPRRLYDSEEQLTWRWAERQG